MAFTQKVTKTLLENFTSETISSNPSLHLNYLFRVAANIVRINRLIKSKLIDIRNNKRLLLHFTSST